MILPKKIRTLKPRVQLRKVGDIFHEAASHGMDDAYLEEVLGIALGSDLLDEDGRERLRSFFSRHDSISFDDIHYYLLSVRGDVPADWDASGDDGDVDWTRRTVFPHALYLDHIRSPFNVGSIFRSAEAFGVESIIIAPGFSNPFFSASVIRKNAAPHHADHAHHDEHGHNGGGGKAERHARGGRFYRADAGRRDS